jgi:hypothetical protein
MEIKVPRFVAAVGLGVMLWPGAAQADWCSWWTCRKDPNYTCQWWLHLPCWPCPEHSHQRAGYDGKVSILAEPNNTPDYVGYYVGGGATFGGEPRCLDEGTWGWDYSGHIAPRRIFLHWWNGRHYQGGGGQYQPDGPISPASHPPKGQH